MPDLVNLTIDGKPVQAAPGTLVVEAARSVGIEIPTFCYYRGLSLQAACRMCLVEVEKMPKLMASCTLPVAEGMVVRTGTPPVVAARKSMLEFLLTNHPLDCPVCDKGGECELQDMVFRYGAGESRFVHDKVHTPEKQWSPLVYYDAPRCILCFRCVRVCREGMGVNALSIVNRGVVSEIAPNKGDHLECDECGMCIDICPVGALTSGAYRYKTRPWEMTHTGTVCAHCADGCTATLGVRNGAIVRANNRDRSGINGEFLCVKGRFGFDFTAHPERLPAPLVKGERVTWAAAIAAVAAKFKEVKERGGKFGVIGSSHTTNEENRYLAAFARQVLGTGNIDHHRTGDVAALLARTASLASSADFHQAKAVLVLGADLAREHPFLAWQVRRSGAHVYTAGGEQYTALREQLAKEPELLVAFGDAIQGGAVQRLLDFGDSLGIPVKYCCLVDSANSRGALDSGLTPDAGGLALPEMLAAELDALWVVGANPYRAAQGRPGFLVVQDLFLTETAQHADVVLPALCAYEKSGTVTNVCGEVQSLKPAAAFMGAKADLEIFRMLAREMSAAVDVEAPLAMAQPEGRARSDHDGLFRSGTLGRYCRMLNSLIEARAE